MIAELKAIWKNAFGDPDWYIDFFFDRRFVAENTLVYTADNKPVSMFFMLSAQINIDGVYKNTFYIYGVSTLPEYQGRGYSTALLKFANAHIAENVVATFLTPASESLFSFYKKQNYKSAFSVKEVDLNLTDLANIPLPDFEFSSIGATGYTTIRDRAFDCHGYIKWDMAAIEYILAENELLGGKAYSVQYEDSEHIILYRTWENKIFVKETTLEGDLLLGVLKKIMIDENVSNCNVRLHSESEINAEVKDFAMIYGCDKINNGYLNLVLD